jgi:hypothetical protein
MSASIPFLNFSLKKVLIQQPDTLKQARIKIVLYHASAIFVKILIAIPLVISDIPTNHLFRIVFFF